MLTDRFVLELDAFDRTATFEFRGDFTPTRELNINHLVGGRGDVISTLYQQASDLDPTDILPDTEIPRRAGFFLDAGGGRSTFQYTANVGVGDDDLQWGDESSAAGEANQYDATGDVDPVVKRDVLFRWLAEVRSDSSGKARLYTGAWTDGTYADSPGVYGEPLPVALLSARAEKQPDDSSVVSYTFEFERVARVPGAVDEVTEDFSEAADDAVNQLGDLVPDF
ncbi:hypothetical protein DVK05_09830 [Halorubrum sp. Atlit-8R]|uniref:hypothetical protein n=1 Tax=Halorubrum sp. Atlit-8R TaxID=2282126 RepID=UPI000EF1EC9B|nr:hypothetical protein [Halorubrum sp. Atlit-8R]RLM81286.1 hypothetical protein DVK05_09830 [Halorubrum sp. Atlit-8R]